MHLRGSALIVALPLLASLVLPVTGCYGDVEAFSKTASKHACKRLRECDKAEFDAEYGGDLERCKDESYTDFLQIDDTLAALGCDYVPEDGKECGNAIRKLKTDCSDAADDEIADACENVYDCPLGLALDPPATGPASDVVGEALASWPQE